MQMAISETYAIASASISYQFDQERFHVQDQNGVAIRTGHHCAMPVAEFFGLPATARASLGVYNTFEEIDILAGALKKTSEMFA